MSTYLGMADIEKKIKELAVKGRDGKLTVGGRWPVVASPSPTVVCSVPLMSTPIINPPQSAILGMHAIQDRPMAVNGQVEILPMMYLARSYHRHRLIDGRGSVGFLVTRLTSCWKIRRVCCWTCSQFKRITCTCRPDNTWIAPVSGLQV
ncbi:2-oxo acid dehydrogenase subunit E2 [Klebsiella pneumoniae]|nr:2-oxo acid dehydrogenase subunit E2 [Klebsiella pneumoniae]